MHVDQIVAGAIPGDAVTESALQIRDALRNVVDADVYAFHLDARLGATVGWTGRYPIARDRRRHDLLIYHVSISQDGLTDFVVRRHEQLMLAYHNITPASFFTDLDPTFAGFLDAARHELPRLLGRASCVVADSEFNASELRALGRNDVHVVPPPLNLKRLLGTPPDPTTLEALRRRAPNKIALFVGQLLPHKRPDLLLAAHHLITSGGLPDTLLVLAGTARNSRYRHALRAYCRELALDNVWITGEVTDAQLAAFFHRADLFVTASEHEGFCVPLVEAFEFGVPVVARDFGAISETAGGAALLLPPESGARELAEAMREVLANDELRTELVRRGHVRRHDFRLDRTLPRMLEVVLECIATEPS